MIQKDLGCIPLQCVDRENVRYETQISHNYKSESLNLANKQLRNRLSYMQSWHIQRISMACRLVTSIFDPDIWVPGITGPDPLVYYII